ncbi:MAG: hypothetical protein FJX61_01770 [Alphaproteobacteria bacterium]|nr:hypothetical protein [Alphaproteobacteria bacterium]
MMTRFAIALGLAALLLGTAASVDAQEKKVRIGWSISKSGFLAVATNVQIQAYELWREQVNVRGGLDIGGKEKRQVEYVIYDDQSDSGKIPQIYEKLINDDKVDLIFTPYATPLHIAMTAVVEKNRMPAIGNTASSTNIREMGGRYMFWTWPAPDLFVPVIVDFLQNVGVKSAALMTLQLPVNLEYKKFTVPLLNEKGIKLGVNQEYPPDIKDVTTMAQSIKASNVDAVIGYSYPGDSILYIDKAREIDIKAPLQFLLIAPHIPFIINKYGKTLDGFTTIAFWSPSVKEWPRAKPFYDAYKKRWNEIPDYGDTVISYLTCEIMEQAVAKVGLDREKLRETIATGTFETIAGPIRFEKQNNASTQPGISQIQNGEPQLVWPPKIATGKYQPKTGWN